MHFVPTYYMANTRKKNNSQSGKTLGMSIQGSLPKDTDITLPYRPSTLKENMKTSKNNANHETSVK